MNDRCKIVVFSDKAYNAIICETLRWHPAETGGFLLGHKLDNGTWYVIEAIPPGYSENNRQDRVYHEIGYFEPNTTFSEYLSNTVANQYACPLTLLGLWHRHPGSMDVFSGTDDETNSRLARSHDGIISGLVNVDPNFRMTMRYVLNNGNNGYSVTGKPHYKIVDIEVGTDLIPDDFLKLKYCNGINSNLNPEVDQVNSDYEKTKPLDIRNTIQGNLNREGENYVEVQDETPSWINDLAKIWNILKKNKIMSLIALIMVIVSIFSFKTAIEWGKSGVETVISWFSYDDKKEPCISKDEITLKVGDDITLTAENVTKDDKVGWKSSNESIATVNKKGKVHAKDEGDVEITLTVNGKDVDVCQVEIEEVKSEKPKTPIYKLSAEEMTLEVNKTGVLTMEGVEDASEIEWTSADNSVATVSNGEVTAILAGTTNILASIAGENYKCKVKVEPKEEAKEVEDVRIIIPSYHNSKKGELSLSAMTTYTFVPEITGDAVKELIQFSSDNPEIATITNSGKVTLKALGTVKITVSYNGKEQDTFMLTIKQ